METEYGVSRIKLCGTGRRIEPPLRVRVYFAHDATAGIQRTAGEERNIVDSPWDGESDLELGRCSGSAPDTRAEAMVVMV